MRDAESLFELPHLCLSHLLNLSVPISFFFPLNVCSQASFLSPGPSLRALHLLPLTLVSCSLTHAFDFL